MSKVPSWGKFILFLSSYSPLFVIIALREHAAEISVLGHSLPTFQLLGLSVSLISVISLIIASGSAFFLWIMFQTRRVRQGGQRTIENLNDRSDILTEYVMMYIFPFITFNSTGIADVLSFVILFATIGAIVIRTNRLYVNPLLVFFRYHVYEVKTEEENYLLLTKSSLKKGEDYTINTTRISKDVYIRTK